mgnify:CR=1 FL=1
MWLLDELNKKRESNDIAVYYNKEKTTYKELWRKSEALSFYLKNIIDLKTPIVIYGEKQTDIIPVMHAALKIGVPYVPVDVSYPIERLMDICNQVEPGVVFNFSNKEINNNLLVYKQNDLTQIFNNYIDKQSNKNFWCHDNDICYILFTSGSTGKPKGVPITKKNLITFSDWFVEYCKSDNKQIVLNQAAYSFDLSVIALYVYLSIGATLYSVDKDLMKNVNVLYKSLMSSGLTDWVSTPSFFDLCSFENSFSNKALPKLNKFIFDGEILRKDTVKTIYKKFGYDSIIVNAYGPTEATVAISAVYINNDMLNDIKPLPVGKINKYLNFYIDKKENSSGELCVIGDSVANGYFKNEEQTKLKFFKDKSGNNGYMTGDIVSENNGLLYFCERKDFQVKLNGYRIELEDISENLNKINFIKNSIVIPKLINNKVEYLAAFVRVDKAIEKSEGIALQIKIKTILKEHIPEYMLPKKIIVVDKFPLNINGKIDRKKLMEEL